MKKLGFLALFVASLAFGQNVSMEEFTNAGRFPSLSVKSTLTLLPNASVSGFRLPTGASGITGTATLAAGTVTVSTTSVTANSFVFVSYNTTAGTPGSVRAPQASIVAGTSFVISSTSGTDTSTVNWFVIN